MKRIDKAIDQAFTEWYAMNGIEDPMDGDYDETTLEYVASKVGMTRQELDWFLE